MLDFDGGRGYLALPEGGSGARLLLLHAWWGLNDYFKSLADRLASVGFVVFAPDLFDGAVASTIEEATALSDGVDMKATAARLNAALDFLKGHPSLTSASLGVVGVSFGAAWSLWLANERPETIAAVVAFYGTNGGGDLSAMRAAFLGHYAETDPFEPREALEQLDQTLTGQGLEATFYVYSGTGHWFFEPDRPEYHAESSRLAWEWTVKFLREKLGTGA